MKARLQSAKQAGFTIIELIVVIAILGILAAVAIPRFINETTNARTAAMVGLAGALNSASALVVAAYNANGDFTATSVTMADGTSVNVIASAADGWPDATASGIQLAVTAGTISSFAITPSLTPGGTAFFDFSPAVTNCFVTYSDVTGVATATISGC